MYIYVYLHIYDRQIYADIYINTQRFIYMYIVRKSEIHRYLPTNGHIDTQRNMNEEKNTDAQCTDTLLETNIKGQLKIYIYTYTQIATDIER